MDEKFCWDSKYPRYVNVIDVCLAREFGRQGAALGKAPATLQVP